MNLYNNANIIKDYKWFSSVTIISDITIMYRMQSSANQAESESKLKVQHLSGNCGILHKKLKSYPLLVF